MVSVSSLQLDSLNPRLGRHLNNERPGQGEILEAMEDWKLDELAISFIESGFWPQEALVVIKECGKQVVLEGNRRLAALKLLHKAAEGAPSSAKWKNIAQAASKEQIEKLRSVPCIFVSARRNVQAYLGFRHVTGIKEWAPAEKASFIAQLIDEQGLSYRDVMRRIGSKTPTVRRHYLAFRLLIQIEEEVPGISMHRVEDRFSVMYLSLRSPGTKSYLEIDDRIEPDSKLGPVPSSRLEKLEYFALWLFGTEGRDPLFSDSRQTDTFGKILGSDKAVAYLEQTDQPVFEVAARMAGTEETNVVNNVEKATYEVEEALRVAHLHRDSYKLREAATRFGSGALQLISLFPDLFDEIMKEYS